MSKKLLVDQPREGVIHLILNRPESENTFDRELVLELRDTLRSLSRDEGLLAVVISGAGDNFCAGADLNWVHDAQAKPLEPGKDPGSLINELMSWLSHLPVPLLVQLNGKASGSGAAILGCADVVVAAESASLAFPEVRIGLVPAVSAPFLISCVGVFQARRLLLSGEPLNAATARDLGLVHLVVADTELRAAVDAQLDLLLLGGPNAQRETKVWLRQLTAYDQHESAAFQRVSGKLFRKCLSSGEAKAGVEAYLKGELA